MQSFPHKRLLEGQKALVTGADTATGALVAESLADAGAKVMLNYLHGRDETEQLAERIRAKQGQAMFFRADVSQLSQVQSLFDVLIGYWGNVDILCINVILADMTFAELSQVIQVNLIEQFISAREVAQVLMKNIDRSELSNSIGKIIFMMTLPENDSEEVQENFVSILRSMTLLINSLAQEHSEQKIRVNGIFINSLKNAMHTEKQQKQLAFLKPISFKQLENGWDFSHALLWLVSDKANSINGVSFYMNTQLFRGYTHLNQAF